jgi:hypothetical protein
MRITLLVLLLITPAELYGGVSEKNKLPEDSVQRIELILDERSTSLDFFKTTTILADASTVSVYSELNYVEPRSWQKKPFIMDGIFNTPVPVGGKWCHIPHHGIYFAMQLHPDITVRILQNDPAKGDSSSPVRTPSFMPGISFFVTSDWFWNRPENKAKHYFAFKIFHNSNGQDGTHFMPDGYWNRYNGDFSDFVIYEFIYGGIKNGQVKNDDKQKALIGNSIRTAATYSYYWNGSFQLSPKSSLVPDMTNYHLYGQYRTTGEIGFIWAPYYQDYVLSRDKKTKTPVNRPVRKEIFRVYANFTYIWDYDLNTGSIYDLSRAKIYDITKRLNATVTFSARIPGVSFAGLFLQAGYYGSDPYNVYFEESMLFLRAGLSMGFFSFDLNPDKQKASVKPEF